MVPPRQPWSGIFYNDCGEQVTPARLHVDVWATEDTWLPACIEICIDDPTKRKGWVEKYKDWNETLVVYPGLDYEGIPESWETEPEIWRKRGRDEVLAGVNALVARLREAMPPGTVTLRVQVGPLGPCACAPEGCHSCDTVISNNPQPPGE